MTARSDTNEPLESRRKQKALKSLPNESSSSQLPHFAVPSSLLLHLRPCLNAFPIGNEEFFIVSLFCALFPPFSELLWQNNKNEKVFLVPRPLMSLSLSSFLVDIASSSSFLCFLLAFVRLEEEKNERNYSYYVNVFKTMPETLKFNPHRLPPPPHRLCKYFAFLFREKKDPTSGVGGGTRKARREPTSTSGRESLLLNWEIYFRLSRNEMRNISLMLLRWKRGMIGDKRIPSSFPLPVNVLQHELNEERERERENHKRWIHEVCLFADAETTIDKRQAFLSRWIPNQVVLFIFFFLLCHLDKAFSRALKFIGRGFFSSPSFMRSSKLGYPWCFYYPPRLSESPQEREDPETKSPRGSRGVICWYWLIVQFGILRRLWISAPFNTSKAFSLALLSLLPPGSFCASDSVENPAQQFASPH